MKSLDLHQVMPRAEALVNSYYVRGLLGGAFRLGLDAEKICEMTQIPVGAIQSNAGIDGEQLQRLILRVREALNDDYLGFLQVPAKLAMDIEAGRAALRGSHLGEALRNLTGFINAVRSDEERTFSLDASSTQVSLGVRLSGFVEGVDPHMLYSYRMYWGYRFYCWLIGQRIKLTEVAFSGPKPTNAIDYEQLFACQVLFGQPADRLSFDRKWLTAPIIRSDVDLSNCGFPLNYPNWFAIPGRDQSLTSEVSQLLIELHKENIHNTSLDKVAGMLSMSGRSLSRKLAAERESFQRIKSKVRCDLAKDMLAHGDMLITSIAEKLGFSEPGDFTRAFVGWTGKTPSAYRRLHRTKEKASQIFRISDQCTRTKTWRHPGRSTRELEAVSQLPESRTRNPEPLHHQPQGWQ